MFLHKFIALELKFTMEKLKHHGKPVVSLKNYGIMEKKTLVLWKKLWYFTENYGTLILFGKHYGTMEKTMAL